MVNLVALVGRVMLSALFLYDGVSKAMAPNAALAVFAKQGIPNPPLAYAATLGVELLAGILLLLGWKTRGAAIVLALWCVATAVLMHYHPADRTQMVLFLQYICMAGGFLQLVAFGPGQFSLDRR